MKYAKTIEEAQRMTFGASIGTGERTPFVDGQCAYKIYGDIKTRQCSHKPGHGPGGLYCNAHAAIIANPHGW